ncbi:RCC1-like domain-containing protein [Actinophytocola sp. KF-1]
MRSLSAALVTVAVAGLVLTGSGGAAAEPVHTVAPSPTAVAGGSTFTSLPPTRVLDTRLGSGVPVGQGKVVSVNLADKVPAGATAVVFNLTGVQPTLSTFVTAYPHGQSRPVASNLNLRAGEIRANLATVTVGADRVVDLYNHSGNTHLVVDLAGYYSTGDAAKFVPLDGRGVLSTHLGTRSTTTLDVSEFVPSTATAVTINVRGSQATTSTFVTAWPAGTTRPISSTVNIPATAATSNMATVALGPGRTVSLYNHNGELDLNVYLTGFYTPAFGAVFTPVNPLRVLDTRDGTGTTGAGPITPGQRLPLRSPALPDDAVGAIVNLTGIAPTATAELSTTHYTTNVWVPPVVNLVAGQIAANLTVITLEGENPGARTLIHNFSSGSVHAAADLAGYFRYSYPPCTSGCAYSWGPNLYHLGIGTTSSKSGPTPIAGLSDVVSVSTHYAALADGTMWGWGRSASLGGDWRAGYLAGPVRIDDRTDVVAVAEATDRLLGPTGLAMLRSGGVLAWGVNYHYTLGPEARNESYGGPLGVTGVTDAVAIAGGEGAAYALRGNGTVLAWGWNDEGQLGTDRTEVETPTPRPVAGLTGVTAIAAGGKNAYALTADGSVWAWGSNTGGKLGDGTTAAFSRVPVRVSGLTDVVSIAADTTNAYAVKADGTVWAWGSGERGGLGNGVDCGTCTSNVPVQVVDVTGAVDVAGHGNGGHVLDGQGRVWGWGDNAGGQLGTGVAEPYRTRPVQIAGLTGVTELGAGGRALVS